MDEWEHWFVQLSNEPNLVNSKLAEWSEQGWEVVGFAPSRHRARNNVTEWSFTLKRPKLR